MCPTTFIERPSLSFTPIRDFDQEFGHCSTNEEVIFNHMLRSARNQIECAFGRIKARWRILLRPMDIPVQKLLNVIYLLALFYTTFVRDRKVMSIPL